MFSRATITNKITRHRAPGHTPVCDPECASGLRCRFSVRRNQFSAEYGMRWKFHRLSDSHVILHHSLRQTAVQVGYKYIWYHRSDRFRPTLRPQDCYLYRLVTPTLALASSTTCPTVDSLLKVLYSSKTVSWCRCFVS